MVISTRALPRRTVLRGIGAALTLPLLDAMVPALTSVSAAVTPVKRLGVVYFPNGIIVRDFIPPTAGDAFEITPILRPLEPFRKELTIISGLANVAGDPVDAGSGPHSRTSGCWLNGVRVRHTESSALRAGRTMDQFAADEIGKDTPFRSLELALEPNFTVGGCEGGYSCTYINTFAWAAADRPLPMETNPAVIFDRLFGEGGTDAARRAQMRRDRSILDAVTGSLARLQQRIGPGDRRTMDEYFDAVRDVERRVQRTAAQGEVSADGLEKPFGIPVLFEDHARLMFDLMYLAFRADLTRVVTFQLGRELSLRSYPEIGVALMRRPMQRGRAVGFGRVHVNALLQQCTDRVEVAVFDRLGQRHRSTRGHRGDGKQQGHQDARARSKHDRRLLRYRRAARCCRPGCRDARRTCRADSDRGS